MEMKQRRGDAPAIVYLVFIGVVLILVGVIATPVYQPLGNASFWLGVVLLVIGVLAIIFG